MGYIQATLEKTVPNLGLWERMLDWMVNVPVKVHEQVRVRMLTLQEILVILVVDSKQVNILEINHLHHYRLMVKIPVLLVSCHFPFPFQVTMELLRMQE